MYRLVTFLILILEVTSLSAQERVIKFRHLVDKDGLSSNSVLSIYQDYRGFMWFGTRDGLNRYDGYEFRYYFNSLEDSTSISHNQVNIIFEDSHQNLWIGTGNGLNQFDREKDHFVRFTSGKEHYSFSHPYIKTICEDSNENIWVGTARGLNMLDVKSGMVNQVLSVSRGENNDTILNVEHIIKDTNGNLWIGTRSGLYLSNNGKIEAFYLYSHGKDQAAEWIREILQDQRGNLWIATEQNGVFRLNYETKKIDNYIHEQDNNNSLINNRVRKIFEDEGGRIWSGTREGLSILNPETGIFQNYKHNRYDPSSLSQNSIWDITSDDAGGIWIATYAGGVNYYHPRSSIFIHVNQEFGTTNTLSYNRITYLFKDREEILWIGTEGRGLNRNIEKLGSFLHFINTESDRYIGLNNIRSITEADNGILWLGTIGGLSRFDKQKNEFINFIHNPADTNSLRFNQVHAILVDRNGKLWIGTNGGGLNRYVPEINGFQHYPRSNDPFNPIANNINVLLEGADGKLWMGTHAGLDCFDPVTERFAELPDISGTRKIMPSIRILCLLEDSHGRFWIGTDGRGLLLLNRNDYSIRKFTKSDGLPNNIVNAILEDNNSNLWISTNRGISRLSFKESLGDEETHISINNFNESEGLQGLQFYPNCAFKDKEGRLYFGGVNGYNVFFPEQISDKLTTPQILFTDFKIKYISAKINEEGSPLLKDISETKSIILNYSQREFSITFVGLNYLNPENVYYSYRLEGMDNQWNYLGNQRTLTFTYLTPGEYKLMVRASDNPRSWGQDYSSLTINVLSPPWKSWWAYLLYILVGTGIFLGILFYSYRWLRLKNKLALEHLSRKKEEELHQIKTRFFTDISHELRTPLTLILTPLEKIISDVKVNLKLRNQLMMIQRNGKRMLDLINQLLDLRKFETGHLELHAAQGNLSRFIHETTLSFREIANTRDIHYRFPAHEPGIEAWYDRSKLEIVMHNLLSNAFKATKPGGEIEVQMTQVNRDTFSGLDEINDLPGEVDDFVKITVEDNGEGIPPELLDRIFDRFYQIDDPEKVGTISTGVGLELTKRMVNLHRGVIFANSVKGTNDQRGRTIFTILLPLGKSHLSPGQIIEDYRTSEDRTLYQKELLGSEVLVDQLEDPTKDLDKILDSIKDKPIMLVVEDNSEVCMFIQDLFKDKFRVHTACNGKEAWEVIIRIFPDVIISDVMMPVMDGIELCRLIKTDKRTSHIPVILLTARTAFTFKHAGLETGADDYVHKPFSSEFLRIRVNNLIRQRKWMQEHFYRNSWLKPEELTLTSIDEKIIRKTIQKIENNISDPDLNVDKLSRDIGLSRSQFYRKIKSITNLTAVEFIRTIRLKKAAQLLEQGKVDVSEVRYMVGIQDASYFRKSFKKQFGLTPKDYATQNSPV